MYELVKGGWGRPTICQILGGKKIDLEGKSKRNGCEVLEQLLHHRIKRKLTIFISDYSSLLTLVYLSLPLPNDFNIIVWPPPHILLSLLWLHFASYCLCLLPFCWFLRCFVCSFFHPYCWTIPCLYNDFPSLTFASVCSVLLSSALLLCCSRILRMDVSFLTCCLTGFL